MTRIAAVQMASGPNVNANLIEISKLITAAAREGAELVALPENFAIMPIKDEDRLEVAESAGVGPIQDYVTALARELGVWIVAGTIPIRTDNPNKVKASCFLIDNEGKSVARYDKMHLFDVSLDNGEEYNESACIEPGEDVVVTQTPFGNIGLAVCYDLRFPELYRNMLDQDVEIIIIPSAFTALTGKAHWEILVRARAIENLAYVIAPDQGGYHISNRETHGDSMIVSPWGDILDRLSRGSGYIIADCDLAHLQKLRNNLPSIRNRRTGL